VIVDVSQALGGNGAIGQHGAILSNDRNAEMGLLAQFTDGGMELRGRHGWAGLIEQRPECHRGQAASRLQHFGHAPEFGLFDGADDQPSRDHEADENGGEGAQGDFPPDAKVHVGWSASRNL